MRTDLNISMLGLEQSLLNTKKILTKQEKLIFGTALELKII